VLGLCRTLYNTALEQRIVAYQRRHLSVSRFQQEAELKDIRAEFPEYTAIHSHVLQDVLDRRDRLSAEPANTIGVGKVQVSYQTILVHEGGIGNEARGMV
jgi:hypothetical protein